MVLSSDAMRSGLYVRPKSARLTGTSASSRTSPRRRRPSRRRRAGGCGRGRSGCRIRGGPLTVGELASRLDLTLPTVSGVLADLDRAGLVERRPDPADRRRTIVQIIPGQATLIGHWLDGAATPLARVLDKLTPGEREAFLKAMDLLETELHRQDIDS